ncbi:MAG: hypothetical protein PVI26_08210 [Chitinispirillia bacterium]
MGNGSFSKTTSIISNASNNNTLQITLRGKILSHLYSSKRFIRVVPDERGNIQESIDLNTEKANLKITSIYFRENNNEKNKNNTPNWQSNLNLYPNFSVSKTDTTDADGYYTYKIELIMNISPSKTLSGNFFFNTNHPQKNVFKIRGIIVSKNNE